MPPSGPERAVTSNGIAFTLEKDAHKSLRLKVKSDGSVLVRAPRRARDADILTWVAERRDWILKRRDDFQRLREELPPTGCAPGDIQRFLGREYPLLITPHARGEVRLTEEGFQIQTRGPVCENKVRALLDRWFQTQADNIFAQRLALWLPTLRAHGVNTPEEKPPKLRVRAMRSRFGSCSAKGVITLNRHLINTPLECIDYVLVHELCHLRHFAHDQNFYSLLHSILPDWRERKVALRKHWAAWEGGTPRGNAPRVSPLPDPPPS